MNDSPPRRHTPRPQAQGLTSRSPSSCITRAFNGHPQPTRLCILIATVAPISERVMTKWVGSPSPGALIPHFTCSPSPTAHSDDVLDSSGRGDLSVEVISPPRRPITCSISAKRSANEIDDDDDPLVYSPPRPRKLQRISRVPDVCIGHPCLSVAKSSAELLGTTPLFERSSSQELIKVDSGSDPMGVNMPSHLNRDYFESENPWEGAIAYF
jgi:hypothetical protein